MIVNVKVVEGDRSRVQAYEGVCIGRSGGGLNESFTVRKISYGEGVERVFPVMSPMIDSIKVVRRGKVRRAKLYYLRNLRGKSARIVEKKTDARPPPSASNFLHALDLTKSAGSAPRFFVARVPSQCGCAAQTHCRASRPACAMRLEWFQIARLIASSRRSRRPQPAALAASSAGSTTSALAA